MGDVIPFKTRSQLEIERIRFKSLENSAKQLTLENAGCCSYGCSKRAEVCLEFLDPETQTPTYKTYCAEHFTYMLPVSGNALGGEQ